MQIFIKTPTDKTLVLEVDPKNSVSKVKNILAEKENIPVDSQRLVYLKDMKDDLPLSEYNIQKNCTITLSISTSKVKKIVKEIERMPSLGRVTKKRSIQPK
jgi:hypothetical protein